MVLRIIGISDQRATEDTAIGLENWLDFIVGQVFVYIGNVHSIITRRLLSKLSNEMLGLAHVRRPADFDGSTANNSSLHVWNKLNQKLA